MRRLLTLVLFSSILASAQNSREAALGNQVLQELGRLCKIVAAPEYMADIVQKLPLTAQGPITVKVVESDQALADTLPGGIVFVSTAVLKSAEPSESPPFLLTKPPMWSHAMERSLLMGGIYRSSSWVDGLAFAPE